MKDQGYIYVPVKKKDGTWLQKFFNYPLERGNLIDWITTEALDSDVYLSPALWKEKKITKESFLHTNVCWIEFDGQHLLKWDKIPEPNTIIQTSVQSHQHCYWRVAPLGADAVEDINHRLTYFLEADTSGYDYQQVLRIPDTINFKHNLPVKVIKCNPVGTVELSVFDIAPAIEKPTEVFEYEALLDVAQVLRNNKLDPALMNKVMNEIVLHPHRSEFLMSTGYLLAEADLDPLEIVTCLYHIDCRIKKFIGRQDQLRRLGEIASIATFKIEQELYTGVYSPNDILTHTVSLDFIIPHLLHSTGYMVVTGQPGVGKTQLCFDLAYRLSTGLSIFDMEISKKYRVAFLSLEMDVTELKYIFAHQTKAFEHQKEWNENCFIISPDIDADMRMFEKTLKEINPDVLIIDSISELATEDLKEAEARTINRWIKKIRKTYSVGIIAIHHNRKPGEGNKKPNKLGDLYGSFLFAKASDSVISMWEEEGRDLIELDELKNRFGKKKTYRLKRTENLTFSTEAQFSVNIVQGDVGKQGTVSLGLQ